MCQSFLGDTSFEGMKKSWRETEVQYHERPGENFDEDVFSVAIETPGLQELWREVETCYHVAWSEYLKRVQESLLVKVMPDFSRDLNILEGRVPSEKHQEQQHLWSGRETTCTSETISMCCGSQIFLSNSTQSRRHLKDCEAQKSDCELHTIRLGLTLLFFDCACTLVFFSWRKTVVAYNLQYQNSKITTYKRDLLQNLFVKKFWEIQRDSGFLQSLNFQSV